MQTHQVKIFKTLALLLALLAVIVISYDYTLTHTDNSPFKHFCCKIRNSYNVCGMIFVLLFTLFVLYHVEFSGYLNSHTQPHCSAGFRRIVAPRPPPVD
jgi:hypothetical protein